MNARWLLVLVVASACSSTPREESQSSPQPRPSLDAALAAVVVDAPVEAAIGAAIDAAPSVAIAEQRASVGKGVGEGERGRGRGGAIVESPMKWSDTREKLTLDYRRRHSDPGAQDLTIEPRVIVLHYTAGSSGTATRRYFDNVRVEASRKAIAAAGAVNVSSHYVIDRDGTIHRLQPETRFARHCIGLNHISIGIENVGDDKRWPLTDAQVAANASLVRDLVRRFPITHLLGHHEVMAFRDHAYYVEREPDYVNDKPDPGAAFMARVRAELDDLALAGPR